MSATVINDKLGSERGSLNVDGKKEYTRVITISALIADTIVTVENAGPNKYDPHPADPDSLCKSIHPRKIENLANGNAIWELECKYTNDFGEGGGIGGSDLRQNIENPFSRPTIYSTSTVKIEVARFKDLNGVYYLNSAVDPFDPPPVSFVVCPVLTARKNVASLDMSFENYYVNKVNANSFYGVSPGYALIENISTEGPHFTENYTFYTRSFEIHFNPEGWHPQKILDAGPRYFNDDMEKVYTQDDSGTESTGLTLLDADGKKTTTPHYLEFRQYLSVAFSGLGI